MEFPFKNKYLLAPMAEVNDIAFRLLCKKAGAGLTYTGMIHPLTQQKLNLQDSPALQLFATNTEGIKEFMKKYDSKVSLWDFNLGCPAKNARKHGFGSFLHSDFKSIEEILKIMRRSTKKPLTMKLRKSKTTSKILRIAEKYCDAVCIHPRTQVQGYSGKADVAYAKKIKQKTKLPVIYSGDVDQKNADELLKIFDYVMVGRKAIGNPNIFSELTGKKIKKINFQDYLGLAEKYNLYFRQIKFQAMCFTKNKENAKELRLEIFSIKNLNELKKFAEKNEL